jgi:hypothetical protein
MSLVDDEGVVVLKPAVAFGLGQEDPKGEYDGVSDR